MEVRGQFAAISSLLPTRGLWGSNSDCQAGQQTPLPTKLSCQPMFYVFISLPSTRIACGFFICPCFGVISPHGPLFSPPPCHSSLNLATPVFTLPLPNHVSITLSYPGSLFYCPSWPLPSSLTTQTHPHINVHI